MADSKYTHITARTTRGRQDILHGMVLLVAYSVPCTACGAAAWSPCRRNSGAEAADYHSPRRRLAADSMYESYKCLAQQKCPACGEPIGNLRVRHVCAELPPEPEPTEKSPVEIAAEALEVAAAALRKLGDR